jgi:hypothetical protein
VTGWPGPGTVRDNLRGAVWPRSRLSDLTPYGIIRCMEQRKAFTLRMDQALLERLDHARGLIPREAYIRDVLEKHLDALDRANAKRRK